MEERTFGMCLCTCFCVCVCVYVCLGVCVCAGVCVYKQDTDESTIQKYDGKTIKKYKKIHPNVVMDILHPCGFIFAWFYKIY